MARFLPLRDICSASEDEDEDEDESTLLTDDVDGPGDIFQKYYTRFMQKFGSRKRAKAKRKKAAEEKEKEKEEEKDDEKDSKPPVDEHEYDFHNAKRGMAIVINNDKFLFESKMGDRKGSKHDADGLVTMFKQLGFDVTLHNNLTTKDMVSKLIQAASNKTYDHEDADCFACAILTHGGEEVFQPRDGSSNSKVRHDVVFGVDGKLVPTRFLLSIFNDECCPELEGKPRLFFIQACRGGKMDEGMGIKVLIRKKKKMTQDTSSGGNDQQDAQLYVSEESEDDDEFEEDDTSSVPNNEAQAQHAKEEDKSVPESKESGEVSQQPHPEQTVKSGEKGDPEDSKHDAAKDDGTGPESKAHPVQESSVQETQAPAEEAMAEEKKIIEEKTKGTPQVEPEVVYSRTTGERNTEHPVQETVLPGGEARKEEKSSTEEQEKSNEAVPEEVVYSRIAMEKILTISPPPIYKDFMLMYAAPPGFFAWRRDTGGWLIQMLVSVLRTADVTNVPLTRLLTTVSNRVSNQYESASRKTHMNRKKLIPCVMSMLTKDVYFSGKHS